MKINRKLIDKLKKRDEEAFNQVYYEFYKLIYYIAYSITLNRETAEEVSQDTFVKMIDKIGDYQERGKFKEWLTEITRNLAKNALTRNKDRHVIHQDEYIRTLIIDGEATNRLILTLNDALLRDEAHIVTLKIIYQYRFREIAETLSLSIGVVQNKYYNAMEKLKEYFKEE